jgi:hypothetical protein
MPSPKKEGPMTVELVKPLKRVVAATLLTLAVLLIATVDAQASQPEAPTVAVTGVSSTGATLSGVLNPSATEPQEAGTYQFVYRPSTTGECKGAEEALAPITPGVSGGFEHEEVFPEVISGLSPGTEYAACLIATEPGKTEPVVSVPVTFKTRLSLEQPETKPPTAVASTAATFNGVLNPNAPSDEGELYNFVYRAESEECRGEGEVSVPGGPVAAKTDEAQPVSVEAKGLLPNTSYTYCLLASTEFGESAQGEAVTFTTPAGAPIVSNLSTSDVRPTEVTLNGTVNPGGATTTVEVAGAGISAPAKTLPGSKSPVGVQEDLSGLTPGATYVVHLTGANEVGRGEAELTFTTTNPVHEEVGSHCANRSYTGFAPGLPDCRAAELVSPPDEPGDVYDPGGELEGNEEDITTLLPFRAAADGSRVAYLADPGLTGGDGSTAKGKGNEYLATRGDAGWAAVNITPPVGEHETASSRPKYSYFSPDLSAGVLWAQEPLLAASAMPQLPERCEGLYGVTLTPEPAAYSALFTETLSSGLCGRVLPRGTDSSLLFASETPDHTVKLFDSEAALVAPTVQSAGWGGNIYASTSGGALKVVNVLPDGAVEPAAVAGAPSELADNDPDLSNVMTPTANRVFWSSVAPKETVRGRITAFPTALYAREEPLSAGAHTIELDEAASGAPGPSGEGRYWTSAADGNEAFFTDCHRLTKDSTAHDEEGCQHLNSSREEPVYTGSDLYEYDFSRAPGQKLVDLTVDHDGSDPLGANVQGVIGTSESGDVVYFVAGGALGAGPNAHGEAPHSGKCEIPPGAGEGAELEGHVPSGFGCNLFELHFNGTAWEAPKFVATLAPGDDLVDVADLNDPESSTTKFSGDWTPDLGSRTAEVTPNGEAVVFSSTQDLTGYDASSAGAAPNTKEQGANEIFLFNFATGSLTCVSCDPQNRPPDIEAMQKSFETYVPISSSDTFMHRWVNAAGSEVFFDSSQPLVDKDVNRTQDVYEWAAQGTPSCPTASSVYGGCIFLLSSGESESFSFLVDTDESGSNAFVVHRGPLYGVGPTGTKSALYDLRASGGQPPAVGRGCDQLGTCPATPAPVPTASAPASNTISGAGNFVPQPPPAKAKPLTKAQKLATALKVCRAKHSRHKRAVCERQAHKRYGPSRKAKAKKARQVPTTHERRK